MTETPSSNTPICQSCGMPLTKVEDYGTEIDGGRTDTFCIHCYQNSEFTNPNATLEEMIGKAKSYYVQFQHMTEVQASGLAERTLPKLTRWITS